MAQNCSSFLCVMVLLNKTYFQPRNPVLFPGSLRTFLTRSFLSPRLVVRSAGTVAVARARRLDGDTFSDLRNGSCDRPPTWLSLVLTDDRHTASSCQLTSGRAKSPTLILTAGGG